MQTEKSATFAAPQNNNSQPDYNTVKLCSGNGQYHSDKAKQGAKQYDTITLAQIEKMLANPASIEKSKATWCIFSTLASREHAEQRQNGVFHALWADIDDSAGLTLDDIFSRAIDAVPYNLMAYTSRSATEANQKARIIIPLGEPVNGGTYVLMQKILNDRLQAVGITPDRVTQRAGQLCYLPNRGEFYDFKENPFADDLTAECWSAEIDAEQQRQQAEQDALKQRREAAKLKAIQRMASGEKSPIDAFNAAFGVDLMLNTYHYMQTGKRYLSPLSESGSPAVVIEGNRWISHHASDIAAGIGKVSDTGDTCSGDAFDLFTFYQHNNDRTAALKAAGEMFTDAQGVSITKQNQRDYMANQNAITADAFEVIEQKAAAKPTKRLSAFALPDYPAELLALPGGLGEVQQFIYNRMSYPSIATAGITALATVAAFAQSHITVDSRDGLGLNEQFMILAATGFGKEDLRKPLEILDRESDKQLISSGLAGQLNAFSNVKLQYAAPSSQQGLHKVLEDNRSVFFLSDEFAEWLRMSHSDSHKQAALGYLMQIYTKALGTVEPGHAVTRSYERVSNPRVGILATSTAEALLETMTREQADSGAYNRWVMFVGDQELPKKRYTGLVYEPAQSVVEFITWIKALGEKRLRFSPAAFQEFINLDDSLAEPIKRKDGVLGGRLSEQAIKLAALFALSDRRQAIEAQDLKLAFTIRIGLYHRAAALAQHEGSLSGMHQTGEAMEQIHQLLKNNQLLYKSQLPNRSRKYNKLSIAERNAVLSALFEHGIAAPVKDNPKIIVSCVYEE